MQMLFYAHSGLRYLVLLVGVVAVVYLVYAVATKRGNERVSRILGATFTGLLDLQILLGIAMIALGLFYSALLGHLFMMIAAAVIAHGAMSLARSTEQPPERRDALRLGGIVIALALVLGGILAIGREVLGSGAPSIV